MNKEQFTEKLCEILKTNYFPDEKYDIRTSQVSKNNGMLLNTIIIQNKENTMAPVFYVDKYFGNYYLHDAAEDIAGQYYYRLKEIEKFQQNYKMDLTSFESVNKHICFKIVNRNLNRELIEKSPYFEVCGDMVGVFYIHLDNGISCKITNAEAEHWHLPIKDASKILYQYAAENTPRINPVHMRSLADVILDYLKFDIEATNYVEMIEATKSDIIPIYVLTNEANLNGASTLFYNHGKILKDYNKQLGGTGLYILPSSTDEVMLVPKRPDILPSDLRDMVREINISGTVRPTEFLSNDIYYYDDGHGLQLVDIEPKSIDMNISR